MVASTDIDSNIDTYSSPFLAGGGGVRGSNSHPVNKPLREISKTATVLSGNAKYTDQHIVALYPYNYVEVVHYQQQQEHHSSISNNVVGGCIKELSDESSHDVNDPLIAPHILRAETRTRNLTFYTKRRVPRVGVMLVGIGGSNGSTFVAGLMANRQKIKWRTKRGVKNSNWFGSLFMSSTTKLGIDNFTGSPVTVPLCSLLPMVHPDDLVCGGWDINSSNLGEAMRNSGVLDVELQDQLFEQMKNLLPLPGIYRSGDFMASNQKERANHTLKGDSQEQVDKIRESKIYICICK